MSAWKRAIAGLVLALPLFAATPASPGHDAYERANALFTAKKFPEALAAAEEALRLDPKLVPALTLKAKLAMAGSRYDLARQCLERALEIDPRAAYAQFLYGLVAYLGNDLEAALPRFRKARQLSPADPRAALYLGLTVESLGDPAQAMSLYQEAVRLERSTGEVHAETLVPGAKLLLLLGRLEESERWIRQAVKASPNSRDAHFELARDPAQQGRCGAGRRRRRNGAHTRGRRRDRRGDSLPADSRLAGERKARSRGHACRCDARPGNPGEQRG